MPAIRKRPTALIDEIEQEAAMLISYMKEMGRYFGIEAMAEDEHYQHLRNLLDRLRTRLMEMDTNGEASRKRTSR